MRKIILDFADVISEITEAENEYMKKEPSDREPSDMPEGKAENAPDLARTKRLIHEYLAEKFAFPSYYGKNLDALFDCLTDISEPTAVGFFLPVSDFERISLDEMLYFDAVRKTFSEAEEDNSEYLAVIFMEGASLLPEENGPDPDEELWELTKDFRHEESC